MWVKSARALRCIAMGLGMLMPALASCAARSPGVRERTDAHAEIARLDGRRFIWVEAECSDGALDLGSVGLDRVLSLSAAADGSLTLIFQTELATEGCFSSAEWSATQAEGGLWRFEPRSITTLPPQAECGPQEHKPLQGSLRLRGEMLELSTHGSTWCRGFDVRFVYRSADSHRLTPTEIAIRYVGAFNRRDPAALAQLFVESGSLIEPFSRTDDGNYKRHEGREAIAAWYSAAFATTPWSALRLSAVTPGSSDGHITASWEYMDARLSAPLRGRNLFVIAGGEIYESELQLLDDPQPLREGRSRASSSGASTAPHAAPTVRP